MSELSPQAQAVLNAAIGVAESPYAEAIAAAALRALTDQVMPERPLWSRRGAELTLYHEGRLDAAIRFRAEILAIAAELEGAYLNGNDVHAHTARLLLEKDEVSADERRLGKMINFVTLYGMGAQPEDSDD